MPANTLSLSRMLLLTSAVSLATFGSATAHEYDSVIAQIPADHAEIGSVALAKLNIALRSARLHAQQTLCNGHWSPGGEPMHVNGPEAGTNASGQAVWQYQSLRQPRPLACQGVSRARFFLEMSRHLPEWVAIRPAGYAVTFRLGETESIPPTSLASL